MSWDMELNDDMLEALYEWIDRIPLSRQKKRIERDFSDAYCVAEIIRHFLPSLIEMHHFTPAHNLQQKLANWGHLNNKIFPRFGLYVPHNISLYISNSKPGYIEVFLYNLRYKIDEKLHELETKSQKSPRQSVASMNKHGMSPVLGKGANLQLRLEYEEQVQRNLQHEEQIVALEAKIRRLEKQLETKEERISELTQALTQYRPTGTSNSGNTRGLENILRKSSSIRT